MITLLVREVVDKILDAPRHLRVIDELFVLIRDLAAIPCACNAMLRCETVSRLAYFAGPESSPQEVKNRFISRYPSSRAPIRADFYPLLQSVFEALAALLGVPQTRKVPLLLERSYWDKELVPEARDALAHIFKEVSVNGGMDIQCMSAYMERVNGPGHRATPQQLRATLDRYHSTSDGRLSFEGFLQYYTEQASLNPKTVWRVRSYVLHVVDQLILFLLVLDVNAFTISVQYSSQHSCFNYLPGSAPVRVPQRFVLGRHSDIYISRWRQLCNLDTHVEVAFT
jgi:hypothetical protein